MATENWPPSLPQEIEQSGYNEGNINNVIATQMNGGPSKRRQRATEAYQPLKGSMLMTTGQRGDFYTFYKTQIAFGALRFNFPEPGVPGNTIETEITNFTIVPVSGNLWRLTMSLRVLVEPVV